MPAAFSSPQDPQGDAQLKKATALLHQPLSAAEEEQVFQKAFDGKETGEKVVTKRAFGGRPGAEYTIRGDEGCRVVERRVTAEVQGVAVPEVTAADRKAFFARAAADPSGGYLPGEVVAAVRWAVNFLELSGGDKDSVHLDLVYAMGLQHSKGAENFGSRLRVRATEAGYEVTTDRDLQTGAREHRTYSFDLEGNPLGENPLDPFIKVERTTLDRYMWTRDGEGNWQANTHVSFAPGETRGRDCAFMGFEEPMRDLATILGVRTKAMDDALNFLLGPDRRAPQQPGVGGNALDLSRASLPPRG